MLKFDVDFKQQIINAYNKDAARRALCRDVGKTPKKWKITLRQKFADLLKKEKKYSLLELGSGAGRDAKFFQDRGLQVLATDISPKMIEICQQRGLNAKVLDLYKISSLKTTFDSIYSMNVMLHVPRNHLEKVLMNLNQSLNEKGLFFYGVYGGKDKQEIFADKKRSGLPMLFSFLSDQTLIETVGNYFQVISFNKIALPNWPGFHFQALTLRKKTKKRNKLKVDKN